MNHLLSKEQLQDNLKKLIEDKDFKDMIFFLYTDGVKWGQEIYSNNEKSIEESRNSSMWWNIAINNMYEISKKDLINLGFSFIFKNTENERFEKIQKEINEIETIIKSNLKNNKIYQLKMVENGGIF